MNGGGIYKAAASVLAVTGMTIYHNTAAIGQSGGLHLVGTGSAVLDRVSVTQNTSVSGGGGMTVGTVVTVSNSTVAGNMTGDATGGGIFSASLGNTTILNTILNTTVSRNTAGIGGGVGVTGPATLTNVTLINNVATDFGGGIGSHDAGAPTLTNVLLSGNLLGEVPDNCQAGGGATILSGGHNLSGDATCAGFLVHPDDKNDVAAGVNATLANNGGPTLTHALTAGSPAIDMGLAGACPPTDQRLFGRNGVCDIGAFEFEGVPPAPSAFLLKPAAPVRAVGQASVRSDAPLWLPRPGAVDVGPVSPTPMR